MKAKVTESYIQNLKQTLNPLGIEVAFSNDKNRWGQVQSKLTLTTYYKGIRFMLASFDAGDNNSNYAYSGLFIPVQIKKKDFFKMTKYYLLSHLFTFLTKTVKSSYDEINKSYLIYGKDSFFINKLLMNSEVRKFILLNSKYNYGLRPLKRKLFHEAGLKSRNDILYITTRTHAWITDLNQMVLLIDFGKTIIDHLIQKRSIRSPEFIN